MPKTQCCINLTFRLCLFMQQRPHFRRELRAQDSKRAREVRCEAMSSSDRYRPDRSRVVLSLNGGFVPAGSCESLPYRRENFHEPRTFGVAERFVIRTQPAAIAIQPWTLLLSSNRVEAGAWKIHDVRVNDRSQLDGDELSGGFFSTRHHQLPLAIASGFDTIVRDGTFELDVSLQEAAGADRAPFIAALIGVEVTLDRDATAHSGPIRLRTSDGGLVPATCDGPARVRPGEAAWFIVQPTTDETFRSVRLIIAPNCEDWLIEDLRINRKQAIWSGPISGEFFAPEAPDILMTFEDMTAYRPLAIKCRYIGSNHRGGRFGALLLGDVLPSAAT